MIETQENVKAREANERKESFDKLSITEKIAKLDVRLGVGKGAVKQRARYARMITAAAAKREADAMLAERKVAAKKESNDRKTKPTK